MIFNNIGPTREPIIFPSELTNLKDILLITPEGGCRVEKAEHARRRRLRNEKISCKSEENRWAFVAGKMIRGYLNVHLNITVKFINSEICCDFTHIIVTSDIDNPDADALCGAL